MLYSKMQQEKGYARSGSCYFKLGIQGRLNEKVKSEQRPEESKRSRGLGRTEGQRIGSEAGG